jgi:hypothetical protein
VVGPALWRFLRRSFAIADFVRHDLGFDPESVTADGLDELSIHRGVGLQAPQNGSTVSGDQLEQELLERTWATLVQTFGKPVDLKLVLLTFEICVIEDVDPAANLISSEAFRSDSCGAPFYMWSHGSRRHAFGRRDR